MRLASSVLVHWQTATLAKKMRLFCILARCDVRQNLRASGFNY